MEEENFRDTEISDQERAEIMSRIYSDRLRHHKWQARKKEVNDRDGNACMLCKATYNLHTHHSYYTFNALPWEYPLNSLWTLCGSCHKICDEAMNDVQRKYSMDRPDPEGLLIDSTQIRWEKWLWDTSPENKDKGFFANKYACIYLRERYPLTTASIPSGAERFSVHRTTAMEWERIHSSFGKSVHRSIVDVRQQVMRF